MKKIVKTIAKVSSVVALTFVAIALVKKFQKNK
jgi:hypothetical protein